MKSWSLVSIVKYVISGLAIRTFGFPLKNGSLAYISPKDLDTDNFPG